MDSEEAVSDAESDTPSDTPSERWVKTKQKANTGAMRNSRQQGRSGGPYSRLVPDSSSFRYSVTSDHKPVFMEFSLEIQKILVALVALTYNMSFASDLGRAIGSERNFVQRAINADPRNPRAYWKNAANLVEHFVITKNPSIMYFQEMNDRDRISPTFEGGYLALLELLAKPETINIQGAVSSLPSGSYYRQGTYEGRNDQKYGFVAYSIKKQDNTFPTVLTIWNTDTLGEFQYFYGNDLGLHPAYNNDPFHHGRNFSCVTTSKGANLINLHGPNAPEYANTKLKLAIEYYMKEAAKAAATNIGSWNEALTVIGGDTNDTYDVMKIINYGSTIYNYAGIGPKSCCAEFFNILRTNDTLNKPYRSSGDKILVKNPIPTEPIYENELFEPSPEVAYGGRRQFHNLKKRKTIKKKHYKLKKQKSLKKRRSLRRKTRKHTHKQ